MPDLLAKTAPEKQSADRLAPRNTALDFVKGKERVEKTTWSRLGVSGESLILKGGLNLDKIGQTSWGDGESWDTAYERYFWLHLQNPKLYPDFWQAYNSESAEGEILRSLPVGEPVDLNSYFYSAGVAEFYERWRKNNAHIPKIYDVIENIDEYQKNLAMPKPNIKNTQVKQTNGGNSKNAGTTTDYNNNTIVACLNGIKKNEFDIASDKCVINGETVLTLKELNSRQEVLNDMELFFGSAIYEFFEDNDSLTAAKNNFLNYNKGKKEKNEKDIKIYNTFENPGIGDESVLITTNFEQNLGYGHKIGLDVWANYSAEVSLNVLVGSCWFWLSGTSVRQKNWGENHQIVYIGKDENKQAKYKIVNKDHNHGQGTIKPILLSYGQDLASRIADVCGGKRTR
jgi:hypothetical protein